VKVEMQYFEYKR